MTDDLNINGGVMNIQVTICPHGVDLRFAKCLMCEPNFNAAAPAPAPWQAGIVTAHAPVLKNTKLTKVWSTIYFTDEYMARGPDGPPVALYLADDVDAEIARLQGRVAALSALHYGAPDAQTPTEMAVDVWRSLIDDLKVADEPQMQADIRLHDDPALVYLGPHLEPENKP